MSAFLTPPTPAASGGTDHGTSALRWGTSWVQALNAAVNANATTALATLNNTSTGASANAKLALGADIGGIEVGINGSGYSGTGTYGVATEAFVRGNGSSAGLYVNASSGVLRFGVADVEVGRWASDGLVAGAGDASATPGASVLRGTKAAGTNIAGSNLTITPGLSTGSGVGGSLVLQAGTTGSAGSAQNAAVTRVTLAPTGTTLAGAVTADTSIWNIGSGQIYKAADGKVGIGNTAPSVNLHVGNGTAGAGVCYFRVQGSSTGADLYLGQTNGSNIFGYGSGLIGLLLQNATAPLAIGTINAQPLILGVGGLSDTNIGISISPNRDVIIRGYDGAAITNPGVLRGAEASGTNTAGSNLTLRPGRGTGTGATSSGLLQALAAAASGTTQHTVTTVAQWNISGLRVISSGATLGYDTGAGGTVTQATGKATGVTLNRPSGQITTTADSLAANTRQRFTLTNSVITANSVVIAHRKSGGTDGAYEVLVDSVAAGSCVIALTNSTAGALAEAVTISFVVLNGATA